MDDRVTLVQGGPRPGFLCKVCRLTFSDNIQYLDHTHSQQHLSRMGQNRVARATLADIRRRLQDLAAAKGVEPWAPLNPTPERQRD